MAKIKNFDLLELSAAINGLISNKTVLPTTFVYGLLKNKSMIKNDVELLDEFRKPSEGLEKFERERIALNIKHAKKDDKNEPLISSNMYVIDDFVNFEKEFTLLKEKFKEEIKEMEDKIADFNILLQKEVEFNFYTIKLSDLPEEISIDTMQALMPIIQD